MFFRRKERSRPRLLKVKLFNAEGEKDSYSLEIPLRENWFVTTKPFSNDIIIKDEDKKMVKSYGFQAGYTIEIEYLY